MPCLRFLHERLPSARADVAGRIRRAGNYALGDAPRAKTRRDDQRISRAEEKPLGKRRVGVSADLGYCRKQRGTTRGGAHGEKQIGMDSPNGRERHCRRSGKPAFRGRLRLRDTKHRQERAGDGRSAARALWKRRAIDSFAVGRNGQAGARTRAHAGDGQAVVRDGTSVSAHRRRNANSGAIA